MLFRATESDLAEIDQMSHAEWGGGLPVQVHLARERALRDSPWSRLAHEGWLMRENDEIVGSCETYRTPVRLASGDNGVGFGIASVFVPGPLRGRGLASRMLGALARALRTQEDALALVLFSDVGAEIYERLGFVARPAYDRVARAFPSSTEPAVSWFHEDALPAIHAEIEPISGSVGLWPTAEQLSWHLARAASFASATGTPRPSSPCGARHGDDVIVWVDDAVDRVLRVLLLTAHDPASVPPLLEAAQQVARSLDFQEVYLWETPGAWPQECSRVPRMGGLPMLAPLRHGVDPRGWTFIPKGCWV